MNYYNPRLVRLSSFETALWALPPVLLPIVRLLPSAPDKVRLLSDWDFSPDLPDLLFTFEPPAGTDRIDFLPAKQAPEDR